MRAIISTQAVIVPGRMTAHILFFKKGEKGNETMAGGPRGAGLGSGVRVFSQLLSIMRCPAPPTRGWLDSESPHTSCLQGKMLTAPFSVPNL